MPVSTLTISRDAHRGGALDHLRAHAVPVLQPVRNVKASFAARQLDGFLQNDDRDGAVHVVVAIDQDFLFGFDGRAQTANRLAHSGEQ